MVTFNNVLVRSTNYIINGIITGRLEAPVRMALSNPGRRSQAQHPGLPQNHQASDGFWHD